MEEEQVDPRIETANFEVIREIAKGSAAVVYECRAILTGECMAIKAQTLDRRYQQREKEIHRGLRHPNIVELVDSYETQTHTYLVLEYIHSTSGDMLKQLAVHHAGMPVPFAKLYIYQLLRALAELHSKDICHRDIKPQNLLVDPDTHVLKLCDFGSAKHMGSGSVSVAYMCARYYRAPELIFGSTNYSTPIDIWGAGCILGEFLAGRILFIGRSPAEQALEIIKLLGTPTRQDLQDMNPNYEHYKFPQLRGVPIPQLFPEDSARFLMKLLVYSPNNRVTARTALEDPYFDELRDPHFKLPDGKPLPPLFDPEH